MWFSLTPSSPNELELQSLYWLDWRVAIIWVSPGQKTGVELLIATSLCKTKSQVFSGTKTTSGLTIFKVAPCVYMDQRVMPHNVDTNNARNF